MDAGLKQLAVFESVGVDAKRVAVGHMCCLDDPKAEVIKAIAKQGAYVGFDRVAGGFVPDDRKVAMLHGIMFDNPRRFLAFVPRA